MGNPALTPDERRIVEWLRESAAAISDARKAAGIAQGNDLVAIGIGASIDTLREAALQIEFLAHRKAEDADR